MYGYEITAVDDSIDIGFEAKKHYENIEILNADIEKMYNDGVIGTMFTVTKSSSKFKTNYHIEGTLKYMLDDDIDLEDKQLKNNFQNIFDKSSLNANLTIVVPPSTKIEATDGEILQNNSGATWSTSYEAGNKEVKASIDSVYMNTSAYIKAGVAIVITGVIVLILGMRFARTRKENRKLEIE